MQIFRTPNFDWTLMGCNSVVFEFGSIASSETQGQIMGARESLNGREKMARTKVKNGRRAPGDNVLPDQFQTVKAVLAWNRAFSVISQTSSEKILLFCHQYEHKDHTEPDVIC